MYISQLAVKMIPFSRKMVPREPMWAVVSPGGWDHFTMSPTWWQVSFPQNTYKDMEDLVYQSKRKNLTKDQ